MYIHEAVKEAMENGKMIYRVSTMQTNGARHGAIKPTNTYDECILIVMEDGEPKRSCRAWNPTADDLMADDWEIEI